MPVGPYSPDVLTHIINVQWGGDVIVTMICFAAIDEKPAGSYEIIKDDANKHKAEQLRSWRCKAQAESAMGYDTQAFKVSENAGDFLDSTAPAGGDATFGMAFCCAVWAFDQSDPENALENSLARAEAGTKLIVPAILMISRSESDIPYEMAPPGLLWLIQSGSMYSGHKLTWTLHYGPHRNDDRTSPPNAMVQCYHGGESFESPGQTGSGEGTADPIATWYGYQIFAYRLDKDGTGTVYGEQLDANHDAEHIIAPEWNVPIGSGTASEVKGILSTNPPPLIGVDL